MVTLRGFGITADTEFLAKKQKAVSREASAAQARKGVFEGSGPHFPREPGKRFQLETLLTHLVA